jgi:hypothetical protein
VFEDEIQGKVSGLRRINKWKIGTLGNEKHHDFGGSEIKSVKLGCSCTQETNTKFKVYTSQTMTSGLKCSNIICK